MQFLMISSFKRSGAPLDIGGGARGLFNHSILVLFLSSPRL